MDTQAHSIYIPIRGVSDQAVRIDCNSLPSPSELIGVLTSEIAPLDIWLKLATEYYKQDRINEFKEILSVVLTPEIERYYSNDKFDRIAMLNALASYYTQMGSQEKDKSQRDEYFHQATFHFTKADKIDPHQPLTWIGKAVLLLCKGDVERADTNFKQVLDLANKEPALPVLPALLGSACILFNKGNYIKALDTYQKVIQQNSNCLPAVRLGLGYCYFKLGRNNKAKEAFKRVLELDRDNVEAMIGLSLVLMNDNQIDEAMNLILEAYQLAPTNPIVLNHLANHYFYRGEFQKVHTLGIAALNNTDVSHIKAESSYLVGKALHATQRWSEALQFYHQAVLKNPDFYLAQFGLGQIYIHNEDFDKAISCFENVLAKQPNNYETLQILGSLYKHGSLYKNSMNTATAANVLKKAIEINPNDYNNWFELAQILEISEVGAALEAYEKGLALLKNENITPSLEILNNIAVLRHQKGLNSEAEQTYLDTIKQSGYELDQFKAVNVTTTYNLARLYESMGQMNRAEELYRGIIKEHPNYYDCYLRLSQIFKNQGDTFEANEWIKEVLHIQPNSQEAWALYGNLHLSKEEWYNAQKKFEQILENSENKNETYATLSLGNLYYNAKFSNPDKVEKYLGNAESFYQRVLGKNPTNIYAANGIGMITAEKGNLNLASDIFLQIREAAIDCIPVSLNLAHVYMARGLIDNAIKLYEGCLKKSNSPKEIETTMHYLSKAYFEANRFYDCKQTLKKAIHLYPYDPVIHFNLAICIESFTNVFLGKHQKNAGETLVVLKELEFAQKLISNLATVKPNPKLKFNLNKAKVHLGSIDKLLARVVIEYESLLKAEQELSKKRELAFEEVKRQEEEKRRKEMEIQAELEARAESERKLAEELAEQTREIEKTLAESERKRKSPDADDQVSEDEGEKEKKKKDKKKKEKKEKKEKKDKKEKDGEGEKEKKKKKKKEKKEKKHKKKKSKKSHGDDDEEMQEG
ncbi:hypothetical protein DICPUDRAFT_50293, partial [Dictyostelium purpureum]